MPSIFIARQQEQLGQFSEAEIAEGLKNGRFLPTDLAWKEGMAEWQPLSTFGLGEIHAAPTLPVPISIPHPGVGGVFSPAPVAPGLPWEDPSAAGWFGPWWETTAGALFAPSRTFSSMKVEGGYGRPLLYLILCSFLTGLVWGIFQSIVQVVMVSAAGTSGEAAVLSFSTLLCAVPVAIGFGLVMAVIGAFISAFVGGAIIHVCLLLFGAAERGYEGTVRAVCYSSGAINALQVIPILGTLVAIIWGPIVYVIALKEAHQSEYWRVICACLIPFLLCLGCFVAIAISFAGSLPQLIESMGQQSW